MKRRWKKEKHTYRERERKKHTTVRRNKLRRDNGISGTIRAGAAVVARNCTTCCAISLQSYIILAPSSTTPSSNPPFSSGVDNRRSVIRFHFSIPFSLSRFLDPTIRIILLLYTSVKASLVAHDSMNCNGSESRGAKSCEGDIEKSRESLI